MTHRCRKCGSDLGTVTHNAGCMIAWTCDACGIENGFTYSPPAMTSAKAFSEWTPTVPAIGGQINGPWGPMAD